MPRIIVMTAILMRSNFMDNISADRRAITWRFAQHKRKIRPHKRALVDHFGIYSAFIFFFFFRGGRRWARIFLVPFRNDNSSVAGDPRRTSGLFYDALRRRGMLDGNRRGDATPKPLQ